MWYVDVSIWCVWLDRKTTDMNFGVRGWVCDGCGCRMSLRAVVVGEYTVSRIIKGFVRAGRLGVSPP